MYSYRRDDQLNKIEMILLLNIVHQGHIKLGQCYNAIE